MNECFGLSGEEADYTQESPWWERAVCTLMLDRKQQPYIMQEERMFTRVHFFVLQKDANITFS